MAAQPFVPHRERHDLHGMTVVVDTPGRLYVGRLDTADDREVVLKDVGYHDDEATRSEFLSRTLKFGVTRRDAVVILPTSGVRSVQLLTALAR